MPGAMRRRRTLTINSATPVVAAQSSYGLDLELSSNQYAKIVSNASVQTGDILFTVACRIKLETKAVDQIFMGKFDELSLSGRDYALMYRTATDRLTLFLVSAFSDLHILSADNLGSPDVDTWYTIMGWHNATTNQTGIQVNNGTASTGSFNFGVRAGTADFRIGNGHSGTAPMDGIIDWAGLWKGRVVDAAGHALLYNDDATLDYENLDASLLTNLTSWWDFSDASSPSLDQHGTNDLTWVNDPVRVAV